MKTIFKSLLYFSFAGLILTGCAKNDDFSVPPINCEEPNITANQTIDGLYSSIKEDSKVVAQYTKDETISGIVISSDQAGNFYQQLYIVDEATQTPVTLKVDIKGGFALYPVGAKVFVKLKDTYIHHSFGMITIGGGIYISGGGTGNKYADVITGSKLRSTLFRSCTVKTGDEFNKYINVVTLEQLKADKTLLGKLIRVNEVQFERAVVGKTYFDKNDPGNDGQGQTLRKMVDKKGNSLVVRTGQYSNGIKDQIIPAESGTITGIVSDFQGTLQFYPRTMADMDLKDKPFEEGTTEPGGPNEGKDVDGADQNTPTFVANFSNWPSFVLATNKYGVMSYAKEAKGQGKDGKGAMAIKGTPTGNDYVYTIENQTVNKGAKSISMWIKGSSSKSLSFNVYKADGSYAVFNLATDEQIEGKEKPVYSKDLVRTATKRMNSTNPKNGNNDYVTGSVNATDWIKITLDLNGVDYNTTGKGSLFAFKVGSKVAYDLLVSDIVFDGGKDDGGTTGPEVPGQGLGNLVFFGSDFKNWADFDKASYNDINKVDSSVMEKGNKNGKDGGNALIINGKEIKKNPYVFSAKNIEGKQIAKDKTKIVFYLKGKSNRGMSINVYGPDEISTPNQVGDKFSAFNIGEVKDSNVSISGGKSNSYSGSIDTNGKWVKVTLDLTTMTGAYNTKENTPIIGVKIGGNAGSSWENVLISGFTFE